MNKWWLGIGLVIVAGGVGYWAYQQSNGSPAPANGQISFAVPSDSELTNNLKAAHLDVLSTEGTVEHIHQHLDITVNEQAVAVPADVGIGSNFISPLHTHDSTGVIHVESPVLKNFTLGQFFTEWGVEFSDTCLATYCADQTHTLIVAVNGTPITDVYNYVLRAHDEIEVWYGPKDFHPSLIKSYEFTAGL